MKTLQHFILNHKIHATIRDYLLPWVTFYDYSWLFPVRFCFIHGLNNLINIKKST